MATIHPWAIVHPSAELAADVEVQAFAIVGQHVKLGKACVVGPHCVLEGRTEAGKGNLFYSGAQIGVVSQDLKHREGYVGGVVIGDNNVFREHMSVSASTITSDEDSHRRTYIGSGCLFMAYSHVGHDSQIGDSVIMANCASLAGHVHVEDGATLGGLCGVHQECAIGKFAFVGGMSRISMDVPPFMIVEGNPARCHGPNSVGLRRNGYDADARHRIKTMYRIIYRSDLNMKQALHEIETTVPDCDERNHFVEFIRKSIRGLTR